MGGFDRRDLSEYECGPVPERLREKSLLKWSDRVQGDSNRSAAPTRRGGFGRLTRPCRVPWARGAVAAEDGIRKPSPRALKVPGAGPLSVPSCSAAQSARAACTPEAHGQSPSSKGRTDRNANAILYRRSSVFERRSLLKTMRTWACRGRAVGAGGVVPESSIVWSVVRQSARNARVPDLRRALSRFRARNRAWS